MADRVLTLRELNRATLARQMLMERSPLSVPDALERLVGLQAQLPVAPYIHLWTRLQDFHREDLANLLDQRAILKATFLRGTLHLVTAGDFLRFRATLQPMLTHASATIAKGRDIGGGLDTDKLVEATRRYISEQPRTFADISAMLTELIPGTDVGAMRYTVRTHLPLVQVPVSGGWSYPGNPQFALADEWLGMPIPSEEREDDLRALITRYLAAFGPASITDMQTWSGLSGLKGVVAKMKPDLCIYRDEQGRELLDLPGMPLPDSDTPVPERFLGEYDNLLLSHNKRTRIIANVHHAQVFLPGLRVRSTFLVDGFVRGAWKVEKTKSAATLVIEPYLPLTEQSRVTLAEEAEKLIRFLESDAKLFDVRFAP